MRAPSASSTPAPMRTSYASSPGMFTITFVAGTGFPPSPTRPHFARDGRHALAGRVHHGVGHVLVQRAGAPRWSPRAASRSWNRGRVDVSLMRDGRLVGGDLQVHDDIPARPEWRGSPAASPRRRRRTRAAGPCPTSSRSTSVSMARNASSPASREDLPHALALAALEVGVHVHRGHAAACARALRATDVLPAPMKPTKNTGFASSDTMHAGRFCEGRLVALMRVTGTASAGAAGRTSRPP